MNPKEKAAELFNKMYQYTFMGTEVHSRNYAKQCALIHVNGMIAEYEDLCPTVDSEFVEMCKLKLTYWQRVKAEINNL